MKKCEIDITRIPFSRYGAYVSVTRDIDNMECAAKELIIHSVRRRFDKGPMFSLSFGNDEACDFSTMAVPEVLTVTTQNGTAKKYIYVMTILLLSIAKG